MSVVVTTFEDRRTGRIQGDIEIYICGRISDTDLEVYIYDDEAEFFGGRVDCRFEAPDYDTGEELIEAFLKELASVLSDTSDTSGAG